MAIVKKEIDYAKEIGDVGAALEELVRVIKDKAPWNEAMDEVVAAIEGVSDIDDELEADPDAAYRTMGYHSAGMVNKLLKKKEDAPAE